MLHTNDKIVKHKVGLLNLADELGNRAMHPESADGERATLKT